MLNHSTVGITRIGFYCEKYNTQPATVTYLISNPPSFHIGTYDNKYRITTFYSSTIIIYYPYGMQHM